MMQLGRFGRISAAWSLVVSVGLGPAMAADHKPAPPAKPVPAATPAQAATPVPNVSSDVGFPSVAEAMHALSQRPELRITVQGPFLNYEDSSAKTMWTFPVRGLAAYPSVIRRQVVGEGKERTVQVAILCEAPKPACDELIVGFTKPSSAVEGRLSPPG